MQSNLVIVESPAKAKTIEKFLGNEFKVVSSYGHIRDLKKKSLSIDTDNLDPDYEIPNDKKDVVDLLKLNASKAEKIWLASDEDREGEAISWHLAQVLGLNLETTNRIVFHEITKPAILNAISQPRKINLNLVDAQQARRILDRLVGFKLSPVLWKKVKPALSAGRVQSVAVRLIVERENEIKNFNIEPYYRINAIFKIKDSKINKENLIKAELNTRFKTREEALSFLEKCKNQEFYVADITKKPLKKTPPPPFTTSTLQQEAARKLGLTVSQTMLLAQHLYESGKITYMRTDSVNLSSLCLNGCKETIIKHYGENYCKIRNYKNKIKGAQEAHEAIRPTYIEKQNIDGTAQEKRLYELIWKRTIASQMSDAEVEKTTITINFENESKSFVSVGEVMKFDGFTKIYKESTDEDDVQKGEKTQALPSVKKGDKLEKDAITATERFAQPPIRYTEASLVHKMEELGIGRPSTYAPTISTIQQREYIVKGDKKGIERSYTIDTLIENEIVTENKTEITGNEKGKLLPTDIGTIVNNYLLKYFKDIMDYSFTAKVEEEFDKIAEGKMQWKKMLQKFYSDFEPEVENALNTQEERKVGEQLIGTDPKTGKNIYVKIGRFGPIIQLGEANEKEKPVFASLPKGKRMNEITIKEALDILQLPKYLGLYEGKKVNANNGKFGPYIQHNGVFISIPKDKSPFTIGLDEAIILIEEKKKKEKEKHIKLLEAPEGVIEILNGRFGPYISYQGKNYKLPKELKEKPTEITEDMALNIINNDTSKKK